MPSEILISITGIIATLFGYYLGHRQAQIREMQKSLFQKRIELYSEYYDHVLDYGLKPQGTRVDLFRRFRKQILMYSSDNVAFKFYKWAGVKDNKPRMHRLYNELLVELRKDLGYPRTKITWLDILNDKLKDDEDKVEYLQRMKNSETIIQSLRRRIFNFTYLR